MATVIQIVVFVFLILIGLMIAATVIGIVLYAHRMNAIDNVAEVDAADEYLVDQARQVTPAKYPSTARVIEPMGL